MTGTQNWNESRPASSSSLGGRTISGQISRGLDCRNPGSPNDWMSGTRRTALGIQDARRAMKAHRCHPGIKTIRAATSGATQALVTSFSGMASVATRNPARGAAASTP